MSSKYLLLARSTLIDRCRSDACCSVHSSPGARERFAYKIEKLTDYVGIAVERQDTLPGGRAGRIAEGSREQILARLQPATPIQVTLVDGRILAAVRYAIHTVTVALVALGRSALQGLCQLLQLFITRV